MSSPRSVGPSRKNRRPLWAWRTLPLPFYRRLIFYAIGCLLLLVGTFFFLPPRLPLIGIIHEALGTLPLMTHDISVKIESLVSTLVKGLISQEELAILRQKMRNLEIEILTQNYELQTLRSTYGLLSSPVQRASILRKLDSVWVIRGNTLKPGQPVLHNGMLAGHIIESEGNVGWVELLSHPHSIVHVLNLRTQTEGVVRGNGAHQPLAILRTQPSETWQPDDWIFTAGGPKEPPGLPIGQVGSKGNTVSTGALSPQARFVEVLEACEVHSENA